MEQEQKFGDIWIPAEIWQIESLLLMETVLLSRIHALAQVSGCCVDNKYLAGFCNVSERYIRKMLNSLKDKNFIRQETDKYGERLLFSNFKFSIINKES